MAKKKTDFDIPANAADNQHGLRKWLPMIILSVALMIIIIDTTVLNVALKAIVNDLHTTLQGLQWVISAYALTLAALTITGGRLGDLFGRKKMFILGAVIFALGSFITSISHSVGVMIAGESIVEGVGAALMMPATASLLVANYRGRDRAIAFGLWGGVAGAASAVGPILGGFLTTSYSWRWAFRINIFVALVLILGSIFIAESSDRAEKRELDFVGVFLSAFGLLGLVYGIIESSTYGWWTAQAPFALFGHSLNNISMAPLAMILGVIFLVLFGFWERRVEASGHTPLVSLSILKNRQFMSGTGVVSMLSLGMVGLIFALPVFFQSVTNLDALHTGLALVPLSLTVLIVAPASAMLGKRFSPKLLVQVGALITVLASLTLYFLLNVNATPMHLAPGLILFGLGLGMVFSQANNLSLSAVPVSQAGEASGVSNTFRQVGSSFGSAIIGAVVLTTLGGSLAKGVVNSTVIPDAAKQQISTSIATQASQVELGGASAQAKQLPPQIHDELTKIAHQASTDGAKKATLYTGGFLFLAFLTSFWLPSDPIVEHPEDAPVAAH